MPTSRGYPPPAVPSPNHPKGRGNKGAGRNKQQDIIGGAAGQPSVSCAQSLFALRTLRHHGLPTDALHTVFQATVVAKLSYASPAWWGLTSAADRDRLEAFLIGGRQQLSASVRPQLQRWAQSVLRLTTNCSRRLHSTLSIRFRLQKILDPPLACFH